MSTTLILIVAAALILLIIILLVKKMIKAFFGLLLIGVVAAGAFFGIRALDNKTNLVKNVPSLEKAFANIKKEYPEIDLIQGNLVSTDLGITVIYSIKAEQSAELETALLAKTRSVLLDAGNWAALKETFLTDALPGSLRIVFKFNGLSVTEYEARRLPGTDVNTPPASVYDEFRRVVNLGNSPSPSVSPAAS